MKAKVAVVGCDTLFTVSQEFLAIVKERRGLSLPGLSGLGMEKAGLGMILPKTADVIAHGIGIKIMEHMGIPWMLPEAIRPV